MEAVCKSLQETEKNREVEGKVRERKKGVTFTSGREKNEIEELMGERLRWGEGQGDEGPLLHKLQLS